MKVHLLAHGVSTPAFQVFQDADEPLKPELDFPFIVKLPAEGGSLGLDAGSVVYNETDLRRRIAYLLARYRQGALVEKFIDGREFTVFVLGNTPPYTLPIVERVYYGDIRIQLDAPEPGTLARYRHLIHEDPPVTSVDCESVAPAALSDPEAAQIQDITIAAYRVLSCQDWARIDLRIDEQGQAYILDVNLEPAIAPEYSLAKAAHAAGWTHAGLVNRILDHAIERYPQLHEKWEVSHLAAQHTAPVPSNLPHQLAFGKVSHAAARKTGFAARARRT
jgi:D-alanine-D-alanine ligase